MASEILDIVDENDKVVEKDTRENIWKRGLEHNVRVVNIFVVNLKNQILLPKRSMDRKLFPGCFDFSCGEHVLSGETYDAAAKRGLKEELGISDTSLEELGKLTPKEKAPCFMKVYLVKYDREIAEYDRDGIDKLFWYSVSQISELVKDNDNCFKKDYPLVFTKFLSQLQ